MLKVILKRLKPQAEEIIAEEQTGFRTRRSTTKQISNLRIRCKSTSNIRTICTVSSLISKKPLTQYGMQHYGPSCGNTISVQIVSDALEEHDGKVSIGGRNVTNLRLADDIDALAEEEQELEALVENLNKTCTRFKIEINAEKTKLMKNSSNGIRRKIKVKGHKLGTETSFKYLGAVVSDDGSKPEILSKIEQATAALTKLKPIWRDNNIPLGSKVKLMRSLVICIFLYACESWTLTAELEIRTQAFEMRCYRRLLNILYKDPDTNEEVRRKIQALIGEYVEVLTLVRKGSLDGFAMFQGLLV